MRESAKSFLSMCFVLLLLFLLILGVRRFPVLSPVEKETAEETPLSELSDEELLTRYTEAEKTLLLWTSDSEMESFLEEAALDYYRETGIAAQIKLKDPAFFLEQIYDASCSEEGGFPDLYLTGGDVLEEACLLGLAEKREGYPGPEKMPSETAEAASSLRGISYAYPLCFDTPVFVYLKEAIPEEPVSVDAILQQVTEEGLKIEVGNILEWDLNDEFYDLAFLGDCYTFSDESEGHLTITEDEALLSKKTKYLNELSEAITLDASTTSEGAVLNRLNHLATACAIIDSDDLSKLRVEYGVLPQIVLKDDLKTGGCAATEMVFINPFSEQKEEAAGFAAFLTAEEAKKVHELTPHYSVYGDVNQEGDSAVVFRAYEDAQPMPYSMDSEDFLKSLRLEILKIF